MNLNEAFGRLLSGPVSFGPFYDGFGKDGKEIRFEDWLIENNLPPDTKMEDVQ